ncbi:MAG: hypothetical protein WD889_00485, partial [Candidatus Colwellbacteria bacterium]
MRKTKLSALISDSIVGDNLARKRKIFKEDSGEHFLRGEVLDSVEPGRIKFAKAASYVILFLVTLRLFQLSILDGERNRALAEGNRVRLIETEALRGNIYDRNGVSLAESEKSFYLEKNDERDEISLEQVLELEKEGLAGRDFGGTLGKISQEVVRNYPLGKAVSHATGYISQVNEEDLGGNFGLAAVDFVGRDGAEAAYDELLRGKRGNGFRVLVGGGMGRTPYVG